jgi:hypothetical protein
MAQEFIEKLLTLFGRKFSQEAGIDLTCSDSKEICAWFLAAKLF